MRALVLSAAVLTAGMAPTVTQAGPTAEVANRCMRYSYVAFPYKRPGSVRMSGDRQAYFRDCMAKEGKVAEPSPPKS